MRFVKNMERYRGEAESYSCLWMSLMTKVQALMQIVQLVTLIHTKKINIKPCRSYLHLQVVT